MFVDMLRLAFFMLHVSSDLLFYLYSAILLLRGKLLPNPLSLANHITLVELGRVDVFRFPTQRLGLSTLTPRVGSTVVLCTSNLFDRTVVFRQLIVGKRIGFLIIGPSILLHRLGDPFGSFQELVFSSDGEVVSFVAVRTGLEGGGVYEIKVGCEVFDVDVCPNIQT